MQRAIESSFNTKRKIFGEDFCDIIGPVFTEGGSAGDSVSFDSLATNVECFVKELAASAAQSVVGGETFLSTHLIEMKRSVVVDAITPRHRIRVLPRDGRGERVFEKPVQPEESFLPLVALKASLVRQGYQ